MLLGQSVLRFFEFPAGIQSCTLDALDVAVLEMDLCCFMDFQML